MKRIALVALITLLSLGAAAQKNKKGTIDGVKNITPEVYDYYTKCSMQLGEPQLLQMADTLFDLAGAANDRRTQCAALCFKQEYYIAREVTDSIRYYMDTVQKIAREWGFDKYYYHTWGRYIEHLLLVHRYTNARAELQQMEKGIQQNQQGMISYLHLMERFYRTEHNYEQALEYSHRLLEYINQNKAEEFNLHLYYIDACNTLLMLNHVSEARALIDEALKVASVRPMQAILLKSERVRILLADNDIHGAKQQLDELDRLAPKAYSQREVVVAHVEYYTHVQQYSKALLWLERFEEMTGLYDILEDQKAALLLHIPGREREAVELSRVALGRMDSIAAIEQNALIMEFAASMELSRVEQKLNEQRLRTSRIFAATLGATSIVMLGFLIYLVTVLRRLKRKTEEVVEVTESKRAVENELTAARSIQKRMLHSHFPSDARIEMCATLEPALHVSGDLYDYICDGDKLHFMVGDVSGKGVGASLFMSVASCSFRNFAPESECAAQLMRRINQLTCTNNPQNTFITAIVGSLDLNTGDLSLCNAGHNLPIILAKDTTGAYRAREISLPVDIPLGLMAGSDYTCTRLRLRPGDKLFVYTDGVTESENRDLDQYGVDRLSQALEEAANLSSQQILTHCNESLILHAAGAPQNDDITMLTIAFNNPQTNA